MKQTKNLGSLNRWERHSIYSFSFPPYHSTIIHMYSLFFWKFLVDFLKFWIGQFTISMVKFCLNDDYKYVSLSLQDSLKITDKNKKLSEPTQHSLKGIDTKRGPNSSSRLRSLETRHNQFQKSKHARLITRLQLFLSKYSFSKLVDYALVTIRHLKLGEKMNAKRGHWTIQHKAYYLVQKIFLGAKNLHLAQLKVQFSVCLVQIPKAVIS